MYVATSPFELQQLIRYAGQCAHRFYGIVPRSDENANEIELDDDIEASIEKEVASITNRKEPKLFSAVKLDMDCVMFFKTLPPIDPVDFVHKICEELVSKLGVRRLRYVNRLTPNTIIGKATEKGLAELGKFVLGAHFQLTREDGRDHEPKPQRPSHSVSHDIKFSNFFGIRRWLLSLIHVRTELTDQFHSMLFDPQFVHIQSLVEMR